MKILKYSTRIITSLVVIALMSSCDVKAKTPYNTIEYKESDKSEEKANEVKIAILLDVSGSMDGLIEQAKSQLWDIVNKFNGIKASDESQPELKIALYEYGSYNYGHKGHIHQLQGFTGDLDDVSEKLFALRTNGSAEYCGQVIQTSLDDLDWGATEDGLKLIFIAGNEPFTQGSVHYTDAVLNSKKKGIVVNTIFCGDYNEGIRGSWQSGAKVGGGEYIAIDHNKKVVHIDTPYDDEMMELNKKLNTTYVSYGSSGVAKAAMQSQQDVNAVKMEKAVAIKRAESKSSRLYKNKSWDLVDALEEETVELEDVDKSSLAAPLQGKSTEEIKTYVKEKKEERIKIQKQIKELSKKRRTYIDQNQKKEESKGELESAINKAIKKQAKAKNYKW